MTQYEYIVDSDLKTTEEAKDCEFYLEGKCSKSDSELCSIIESEKIWNQD